MTLQTVQSTQGRSLDFGALRGKAVVVFYEERDHVDDNVHLKESCGLLLEGGSMGDRFEVLGVADVAGLSFVRGIVRTAVKAVAARYGTELWLDFEGALREQPWDLGGAGSAVMVLDPTGRIVFRRKGALDPYDLDAFFEALGAALDRGAARRLELEVVGARGV